MTNYKSRFETLNVAVNNTKNLSSKMHDRIQGIIQEPQDTRSTREKLDDKAMQNIEFRKKVYKLFNEDPTFAEKFISMFKNDKTTISNFNIAYSKLLSTYEDVLASPKEIFDTMNRLIFNFNTTGTVTGSSMGDPGDMGTINTRAQEQAEAEETDTYIYDEKYLKILNDVVNSNLITQEYGQDVLDNLENTMEHINFILNHESKFYKKTFTLALKTLKKIEGNMDSKKSSKLKFDLLITILNDASSLDSNETISEVRATKKVVQFQKDEQKSEAKRDEKAFNQAQKDHEKERNKEEAKLLKQQKQEKKDAEKANVKQKKSKNR